MRPSSAVFDQSTLACMLEHDPVVQDYHAFFALLDWSLVEQLEQWQAQRSRRGRPPHLESAYLKAFLIRIREGFVSTTELRCFLVKHPLLVIDLGFHLKLDVSAPYGFDVQHTLPCASCCARNCVPSIRSCCKRSCMPRCMPCRTKFPAWAK
jgi:hypothetical protein